MQTAPDSAISTTLTTQDGLELPADVYLPVDTPRAVAVLAHGFSASRRTAGVPEQALSLQAQGWAVVAHDSRGHGTSPGACTMGSDEVHDVAAAVEYARRFSDVVVVVGASMGAIGVLRYAAGAPEISGVVAISGPATFQLPRTPVGVMASVLTMTRPGRAIAKRRMGVTVAPGFRRLDAPIELVTRIAAPLAIVHGTRDHIIPVRAAHQLYAAATGPRALHVVDGMGHAFEPIGRATVTAAAGWTVGHPAEPDVPAA